MSYSRRELYAMGEPFGECATERKVDGRYICGLGGGGGGQPANTTQQVTQELPAWARPYAKESLAKASALSDSPYQAYGGERIAQFSPLQRQAFGQAGQQQVAGQIGFGSGLAGLAGTSSFGDQGTAANFMSPYMQQVVDQQMSSAHRHADIAATQRGAQAVRAGAFGGSRQAIENAEAARALASQKGDIQAKGLQSAFERGQAQFNAEQANRLSAAQALGQLGTQQFGQQMDIMGRQADFGAQQRAATQDILSTQYQDFLNQQRAPYDQLAFMTSMIRGTPMGGTTAQYQTQAAPSATSQLIGLGTAAAGAYGAAQGRAAGGEVHSYAAGGIASLNQPELAAMAGGMSDQQLGQTAQMPSITELAKMTLAAEAQQRAQMRQQAMAQQAMMQQPQGTVAEEQMAALEQGIGGLDVPDDLVGGEYTAAGGGIVAFQTGGEAVSPFQEMIAPFRGMFGVNPVLADLRDKRAAAEQGFFEALTPSEKKAREAEVAALDQQIKSLGEATPAPQTPAASGIAALAGEQAPIPAGSAANRSALNASNQVASAKAEQLASVKPVAEEMGDTRLPALPGAPSSGGLMGMLESEQARRVAAQEEIDKLRAADVATARGELDAEEKLAREFGSEREARLKKQEDELGKEKGQTVFKTMIQTGLAIAAGRSPNALQNIAEGAAAGLEGYEKRMATIRVGQEKLDENFARLAEIREEKVSAVGADRRRLLAEERNIKTNSKVAIEGIMSSVYDKKFSLKEKDIERAFEMSKVNAQNAAANARAQMADDRADNRARMSAAQDLLKSAEKIMLESADAAEVEQAKKDFAAASGVLRSAAGVSGGTLSKSDQALINKYR